MLDTLLLRFRDLVADTIREHNDIVENEGSVWWGWWKKGSELMPDPGLTMFGENLRGEPPFIYFINSDNRKLYRAPLFDVFYRSGDPELSPPDPNLCLEYYRDKRVPAWFKIGKVEDARGIGHLDSYVFSRNNRTSDSKTITSLHDQDIRKTRTEVDFLDSNVSLWFITHTDDVGILQRSDIVPSLSKGIWPTKDPAKGLYAIHLSDLHFGTHHAFRNHLAPPGGPRIGKQSMFEALVQDLEDLGIKDRIALVLIIGDFTWTGESHEFNNAKHFLQALRDELGLHVSQIVAIPGNHDIEWRDAQGDIDPNAEQNYSNFCKDLYNDEPEETFLRVHRFKIGDRVVCIIGLNTCRIESRENAGLGFVGREQLRSALSFLRTLDSEGEELRLALVHHHLLPVNFVEDIDWDTKRISISLDAEEVIRALIDARVRAVFHGHHHQPYFTEIRRIVEGFVSFFGRGERSNRSIAVVGGGSIGVERSHLSVIGRNAYNLIDLGKQGTLEVCTRIQSASGPGFTEFQRVNFKTDI